MLGLCAQRLLIEGAFAEAMTDIPGRLICQQLASQLLEIQIFDPPGPSQDWDLTPKARYLSLLLVSLPQREFGCSLCSLCSWLVPFMSTRSRNCARMRKKKGVERLSCESPPSEGLERAWGCLESYEALEPSTSAPTPRSTNI